MKPLCLLILVLAAFGYETCAAQDWFARGSYYTAGNELGQPGSWGADSTNLLVDDGTRGDAMAGDGIFSRQVTSNEPAAWHEFKIGTLDWSDEAPQGFNINLAIETATEYETVLVTFDTNLYEDGWIPSTRMVWSDKLVQPRMAWYVVGSAAELGSWEPSLGPEASAVEELFVLKIALQSTGVIEYKWTADRTWVFQEVGGQGFSIRDMAHNAVVLIPEAGTFDFVMNPANGRLWAGAEGSLSVADLSWSRLKRLYGARSVVGQTR